MFATNKRRHLLDYLDKFETKQVDKVIDCFMQESEDEACQDEYYVDSVRATVKHKNQKKLSFPFQKNKSQKVIQVRRIVSLPKIDINQHKKTQEGLKIPRFTKNNPIKIRNETCLTARSQGYKSPTRKQYQNYQSVGAVRNYFTKIDKQQSVEEPINSDRLPPLHYDPVGDDQGIHNLAVSEPFDHNCLKIFKDTKSDISKENKFVTSFNRMRKENFKNSIDVIKRKGEHQVLEKYMKINNERESKLFKNIFGE